MHSSGMLDSAERAREKQESRDLDEARLKSGEVDREALAKENNFFSSLPIHRYKIRSVGGVPVRR